LDGKGKAPFPGRLCSPGKGLLCPKNLKNRKVPAPSQGPHCPASILIQGFGKSQYPVFTYLIESKLAEWDEYRVVVHPYEIERYLPIL
jgi:hypothetical protein